MQPKSPGWLFDILEAATLIEEATAGKSFGDYDADPILRSAVERQFQIIGEAIGRVARHDPDTANQFEDYPAIIALRNVLVHGYDQVDNARMWGIIQRHLPRLKRKVKELLDAL
jgi:uncharacterized protein with HEPN domain